MSCDPLYCGHCGRSIIPGEEKVYRYPGHPDKILCEDHYPGDGPGGNREERRERHPQRCKRICPRKKKTRASR